MNTHEHEAIKILRNTAWLGTNEDRERTEQAIEVVAEALEQESIKFYYVESLDDYWVGLRIDNFYYATWHRRFGFIWSYSKYLPWGEHIVDENTLWKEHTYPSEPKEIPFTEWIIGFTKKYFQQEPKTRHFKVVRCRECEYWKCNPNTKDYGTCEKASYDDFGVIMEGDDFCSYGIRIK